MPALSTRKTLHLQSRKMRLLALLLIAGRAAALCVPVPLNITVEYTPAGLNATTSAVVDVAQPRFSWKLRSPVAGARAPL